jgi:branched-chain amino acid transport system permease protein
MQIPVVVGALAMMLAVEMFNRKSIYGKAVVATFNDRDAAKPDGHQHRPGDHLLVRAVVATAAFAGVLIAPLTLTGATMGAVAGPEGLRGGHHRRAHRAWARRRRHHPRHRRNHHRLLPEHRLQGSAGLVLLLLVLAVKPAGLFGKAAIKKV